MVFKPTSDFGNPRSLVALPFRAVDIDGQARSWRLREQGHADGLSNQPAADATTLSAAEQKTLVWIEAERTRLASDLIAHLRVQNDAIAQLDTAMDIAGLRKDAAHAVSQLEQTHVAWNAEIPRLLRHAREAKEEYVNFRKKHKIDRPPRNKKEKGLSFSLLAFAIVIESIFNGFFFAEGSDSGVLGGITVAFSVSFINVVIVGYLLGAGPARYVNFRSWPVRLFSLIILALGLALAVILNAFVGHYRDAYEIAGDGVKLRDVWAVLLANPFDLARLQSWFLFFIGLACAGFGFWKGYSIMDPYPGYGAVAQRWHEAEQEYLANRHLRLEEATAVRDEAIHNLSRGIESLRGAAQQRAQVLGQRARMIADFAAHEQHLAEAANALLAVYREANTAVRTSASPAPFAEKFAFEDPVLERPTLRALRSVEVPRHDAEGLVDELDRLRDAALTAYRNVYDEAPAEV